MQQHQRLTANQEALCAPLAVTRQLSSRSRSHLSSLSCCVGGAPMLVSVLLVRWAERGGERHLLLCTAAPDNSSCSIEACHPRQQLFTHQLGTLMAVCVLHLLPLLVQVASFYSWQPPVSGDKLTSLINTQLQQQWAATVAAAAADSTTCSTQQQQHSRASGDGLPAADAAVASMHAAAVMPPVCPLRVWHAELVPRQFHPTFAATHRRYVYLLPLRTPSGALLLYQKSHGTPTSVCGAPGELVGGRQQARAAHCIGAIDPV